MEIYGLNKTTLLDYPGIVAATVFTGGCNFRCPFCHNRDLVLKSPNATCITESQVLGFLKKRRNILDGVCISGGEPTLNRDLIEFVSQIRLLGLKIKLDTNGSNPELLKELVGESLIDYCAIDVKNSKEKYALSVGYEKKTDMSGFDINPICESISYIIGQNKIDYELRTTVVRQLHTIDDFTKIGEWIYGAKHYFLQPYVDSGHTLKGGYSAYDKDDMGKFVKVCKTYVPNTFLRGM